MSLDNAFFLNKDLGLPKLILFLKIVIDMDHTRCVNLNYSIAQIHSIMQNGWVFFSKDLDLYLILHSNSSTKDSIYF